MEDPPKDRFKFRGKLEHEMTREELVQMILFLNERYDKTVRLLTERK